MFRNELIKFFQARTILLYIIIMSLLIIIFGMFLKSSPNIDLNDVSVYNFSKMILDEFTYYLLPLLIIFFVSNIFSKDIYDGELKFFMIGENNRAKILVSKIFVSLLILLLFVVTSSLVSLVSTGLIAGKVNEVLNINKTDVIINVLYTVISIIPLLMTFILISTITKQSTLTSICILFLLLSLDQIFIVTNQYTPTGILKTYLQNGQIQKLTITMYPIVLAVLSFLIFNRKDMVE